MPPSDERIITPEQVAEIRATHRCRKCMGTGRVEHGCSLCGDSTYDHDCNDWSETCDKCSGFGGDADIDALLASHAALRAERDALGEEARCFDAVAEALGVDSTEERFWVDDDTKDTSALMEAVKARVADLKKRVQHGQ